jgi:hypothetical protein
VVAADAGENGQIEQVGHVHLYGQDYTRWHKTIIHGLHRFFYRLPNLEIHS